VKLWFIGDSRKVLNWLVLYGDSEDVACWYNFRYGDVSAPDWSIEQGLTKQLRHAGDWLAEPPPMVKSVRALFWMNKSAIRSLSFTYSFTTRIYASLWICWRMRSSPFFGIAHHSVQDVQWFGIARTVTDPVAQTTGMAYKTWIRRTMLTSNLLFGRV